MQLLTKQLSILLIIIAALFPVVFANTTTYEIRLIGLEKQKNISANVITRLTALIKAPHSPQITTQLITNNVKAAIEPFGYFSATVSTQITIERNIYYVNSNIQLNEPTHIGKIDLNLLGSGKNDIKLLKTIKNLPIKEGDIFDALKYDQAKDKIINWCSTHGYIYATFAQNNVLIDRSRHLCTIILNINTDKQYIFGETTINDVQLEQSLIKSYLQYKPSDIFSSDKLIESQDALVLSNYFSNVHITPNFEQSQNNKIPINVDLSLKKKIGIETGVGYGTDTHFEGFINIDWRRINMKGHQIKTILELSEVSQGMRIEYAIPGTKPITDRYQIITRYKQEELNQETSKNFQIGFYSTTKIFNLINRTLSLRLAHDSFKYIGQTNYTRTNILIPQISLEKTNFNDNLFPTKGHQVAFTFLGTHEKMLSNTTFLQSTLSVNIIKSFHNIRLISKNKIGYMYITHNIFDLPPSIQFLEGGITSIRGYELKSIGPGRYLYKTNIDIQIPLPIPNWYISPFFDAGNVCNDFHEKIKTSAGFSIIYKSGLGPISIGIAKAFQTNAPSFKFIWSIGPEL